MGKGRGLLVARLFCFAPHARVVQGEPDALVGGHSVKARRERGVEPAPRSAAQPSSPSSEAALAAYLGRKAAGGEAPSSSNSHASSAEASITQGSTSGGGGSGGEAASVAIASGSVSGSGYEGDSSRAATPVGILPDEEVASQDGAASSRPRFKAAVRSIVQAAGESAVAADDAAAAATAAAPLNDAQPEPGSALGSCLSPLSSEYHDCQPVHHMQAALGQHQHLSLHLHLHGGGAATRRSCNSLAASASLAHWILPGHAGQHSYGPGSNNSSLSRLQSGSSTVAGQLPHEAGTPATATRWESHVPDAEPGAGLAVPPPPPPPAAGPPTVVQRRLTLLQSGHHVSLEKLRSQAGDLREPAGDLLSLMARRVFARRSSCLLQPQLCSQGMLSDLNAEESHPTPSTHHPPTSPHTSAASSSPSHTLLGGEGLPLPRLPRIRTRVGGQQQQQQQQQRATSP